jgi:hypothetical protein
MVRSAARSLLFVGVLGVAASAQEAAPVNSGSSDQKQKAQQVTVDTASVEARAAVKQRLAKLGLTQEEADSRIQRLTDKDIQKLGSSPESIAMAGVKDRTLVIIALILILPSILLLAAL